MQVELKKAIMPKQFISFVAYLLMQFTIFSNSKQTILDISIFAVNIAFAVLMLLAGMDNPSVAKFFKDLGGVMLDFKASPQLKLQQIQSMWQQFALLWMIAAEEVAAEEKKEVTKSIPEMNIEKVQ